MQHVTADKSLLARRFLESMATYDRAASVQREMAGRLVDDLLAVAGTERFERVLELGCGTGLLTERLLEDCRPECLVLNDLVPECERTARRVRRRNPGTRVLFVSGDLESAPLPGAQDLVASNAVFQWATAPENLPARLAGWLRPGGILAMATFGPENLRQVSRLTGSALHYLSAGEWRETLSGRFDVLAGHEEVRTLRFRSAREVLDHLRRTGVNALDARPWTPAKMLRFCRTYEGALGHDNRVPLTYHPVFTIARKRA